MNFEELEEIELGNREIVCERCGAFASIFEGDWNRKWFLNFLDEVICENCVPEFLQAMREILSDT